MGMTATSRIVQQEVTRYLERDDLCALGSVQKMEERLGVWLWGKWALKGDTSAQGIKRQLKFKTSRSEMTAWEAIPDISDDDGMRIDAAISSLGIEEREIMKRIYMYWESTHDAPKEMRITRHRFIQLRDLALAYLAGRLL